MIRNLFLVSFLLATILAACTGIADAPLQPVYIGESEVIAQLSAPPVISLHITGDLPTACNEFQSEVEGPDAENRIDVTVYSTIDPAVTCMQGLVSFDESVLIPMEDEAAGTYFVYLNGTFVGQFEYVEG